HYSLGALLMQNLAASGAGAGSGSGLSKEAIELSNRLTSELSANEKKLDPKSPGASLAPAMIFFYRGQALRLAERYPDALAAYETVISVYPINEWPDAAACGSAECYAALGETAAAIKKFEEVAAPAPAPAPANPATAKWRDLAKSRIAELQKGH